MISVDTKELCMGLISADSGDHVIEILEEAGYWNNATVWRYLDDRPGNYSTIGNQQSDPVAALVEKLVNSIDARLMNECLLSGIAPDGPSAPRSIREAVARFFEGAPEPVPSYAGLIREWPDMKRLEVARGVTLAATGSRAEPCITIADCGEGQTPQMVPKTFLSLSDSNKMNIPFVQGRFQMGGTGALKFCGRHNLQLIVTRRNPAIVGQLPSSHSAIGNLWSFTVIRREDPEGDRRNSVYTYLAPVQSIEAPAMGTILTFDAERLPIFPDRQSPYARESEWGTLIKLYDYEYKGRSHILRSEGLLTRLDMLLPEPGLPVRLHECRDYGGGPGSFDTTLTGLRVRLDENRGDNLEDNFPYHINLNVKGQPVEASVYAFRPNKEGRYRKSEGVLFTLNGQTHGIMNDHFFSRRTVDLGRIRKSLLVLANCSALDGRAREDLFMNSRDRLIESEIKKDLEDELMAALRSHNALEQLRERRRREEIDESLADDNSLAQVLQSVLTRSRSLAEVLARGENLPNPFDSRKIGSLGDSYSGEKFPTFFHFARLKPGQKLSRDAHINHRVRIEFDTDATNDYFNRHIDRGEHTVHLVTSTNRSPVETYTLNLKDGTATLNLRLPANVSENDALHYAIEVTDPSRIDPFRNEFTLRVTGPASDRPGKNGERRTPPGGSGNSRNAASALALPKQIPVRENDQNWTRYGFDSYTAIVISHEPIRDESGRTVDTFDFFINLDNYHLKRYQKYDLPHGRDPSVAQHQFQIGLVLVGLSLVQNWNQSNGSEESDGIAKLEDNVRATTRALAPFLLPMLEALGSTSFESSAVD